jgi:hypothetical protein
MSLAIAAGFFMPAMPGWRVAVTPEAFTGQAAAPIDAAGVRDVVSSATSAAATLPDATPEELDALRAVESELAGRSLADQRTGRQAAAAAEQIASKLEAAADQKRAREEAVRQELQRRLGQSSPAHHGDLSSAMRAGDLEAAARAASDLAEQASKLPIDDRREAAEELSTLAESLERASNRGGERAPDAKTNEQVESIAKLARDAAKELRQPPSSKGTPSGSGSTESPVSPDSNAASRVSDREQSRARSSTADPKAANAAAGEARPASSPSKSSPEPDSGTAKPQGESSKESQPSSATSGPTPKPDSNRSGNNGGVQGDQSPQPVPSDSSTSSESAPYRSREEQGSSNRRTEGGAADRTTRSSSPRADGRSPEQEAEGPQAAGDQQRQGSGAGATPNQPGAERPSSTRRLAEAIERMAESSDESRRMEGQSRSLREQARELLDRMKGADPGESPSRGGDQPREDSSPSPNVDPANAKNASAGGSASGRVAGGGADRTGRGKDGIRLSGPTEAARPFNVPRDLDRAAMQGVDARPLRDDEASSRVVAEWESPPERSVGKATPAAAGGGIADGVSHAAKSAERAVDSQQVPAQYGDLVRRVFKRYLQRTTPTQP